MVTFIAEQVHSVTGDADIDDAAVADSGVILEENFSGALTLTASMASDTSVTATNTLQANSAHVSSSKIHQKMVGLIA